MRSAAFQLLPLAVGILLLTAVSCTPWRKQPEKQPVPPAAVAPEKKSVTPPVRPVAPKPVPAPAPKQTAEEVPAATPFDAPEQYFFPHGHGGQLAVYDDYVVHAPSWTRGDGISFFDVSDPDHPFYAYGLPSAGYTADVVRRGNVLYFATGYSILTVKMPVRCSAGLFRGLRFHKDVPPVILENTLIAFPNGNSNRMAISGDHLYITAADGLREYSFADDGRPEYRRTFRELKNITAFTVTNGRIYYLTKNSDRNIFCCLLSHPDRVESVQVAKIPVERLLAGGKGQVFLYGKKKLLRMSDFSEVFPGAVVKNVARISENTFSVQYSVDQKMVCELTDGVSMHRMLDRIPAGSGAVTGTEKGDLLAWTNGNDVCFLRENAFGRPSVGKLPQIIRNEAPVTICGNYVYSIDRIGSEYTLYGYRIDRPQSPDRAYDVCISWQGTSKKQFYYDIVIPPFSFYHFKNYLFAPEAILDVSDPASPKVIAKLDGAACSVAAGADGMLFLAQGYKLIVLDGKALPEVRVIAEIPVSEQVKLWTDIEADGKYLYMNAREKLQVFRMDDPKAPRLVAELPLPGMSYKIFRSGKMLYLPPYGGDGTPFRIIDVSRPEAPAVAGTIPGLEGHGILGVSFYGGNLYVADGIRIQCYSLKDPAHPHAEQSWSGPDRAMQGYLFMDVRNGLLIGKKYPRFDVWRISK